jgi:hypothetical protein
MLAKCRCLLQYLYRASVKSHGEFGGDVVEARGDAACSW